MDATIAPRSGHDHVVIGPQSWVDPWSLDSKATFQRSGRWFRPAWITIAARSRRDRGVLPQFVYAVRMESDAPDILRKEKNIGRRVTVRSRSCGLIFYEDGLSSCRHVATGEPSDRRHLNRPFAHVLHLMIAWTRVHAITAVPPKSNAPHAATRPAKQKPCGNIVPHGGNTWIFCS